MKDAGFAHLFKIASYDPKENESAVNKLIFYLKLKKDKLLFKVVASLAAPGIGRGLGALSAISSDSISAVVTFIPRSRAKMRTLGNDQARMLARYLAKELSLPCVPLLVRRKQGKAQKELSLFERELNTESMFRIRGAKYISGKTVIVVDDLVASGNTMAQAGLALKRAGVKNVLFSCIAALEKKPKDDRFAQDIDIFG
jgi:predicted amidophosphoribosyltransferase